ncbi:hypothetical protein AJ78_00428 [Emergomyces pasteurianus Ep9510]|uniref:Uncharacterized protein n=1 Tax=Emergomyces pasteurianus Ep9510 TaxID=1447872 RepID=A0A1J9QH93_9EURO|nr:hypothetical protein AJ78_00428 [Emergomyces pasteurianus Ep9510]
MKIQPENRNPQKRKITPPQSLAYLHSSTSPRSPTIQPGQLIIDALARLRQPTENNSNKTTASVVCTFNRKYNSSSSASDPTASLAYINPALLQVGKSDGNGTGLCGTPIIVINPFLNKAISATIGGGCMNCSMYDVELSEGVWRELTGERRGGAGVDKEGLEGLKLGSVWRDGREKVGVSIQWMISPLSPRQRQLVATRNLGLNSTQLPNPTRKGRLPIPPGISEVQTWVSGS